MMHCAADVSHILQTYQILHSLIIMSLGLNTDIKGLI